MSVWLVKVVHMAAISVWVGGLLGIPALFMRRSGLDDVPLDRLHRTARFVHVSVASPAAFVGIASGIALIFLQETWVPWFAIKLGFVGLLVVAHIATGALLVRIFEPDGRHNALHSVVVWTGVLIGALGVLWAVLAKPVIDLDAVAGPVFAPGGLGDWFQQEVEPVIDAATP